MVRFPIELVKKIQVKQEVQYHQRLEIHEYILF